MAQDKSAHRCCNRTDDNDNVKRTKAFAIVLALTSCAVLNAQDKPSSELERIENVVNVRDFGALGDGSAATATAPFIDTHGRLEDEHHPLVPDVRYRADWDTKDFVGIQAALDYAGKHGKKVYIPEGKYILSRPIFLKYSGLKMFGDGMHKSLIYQGSKAAEQNWKDEPSDTALVKIGMTVFDKATSTADYGTGQFWAKTQRVTVNDCEVSHLGFVGRGGPGRWWKDPGNETLNAGILLQGHKESWATGNTIHHCFLTGFEEAAIEPEHQRQLMIADNECRDCGWQFVGTDASSQYVVITRNTIINPGQNASRMAINFECGDGLVSKGIVVSDNVMTGTHEGFFKLNPHSGSTIEDILVINNKVTCYTAPTDPKMMTAGHACIRGYSQKKGDIKRWTIANNVVSTGQGQHCIAIGGASDVVISGNTLDATGGGYGIWATGDNQNVAILGNTVTGGSAHPVVIGDTAKQPGQSPVNVRICHNRVKGRGARLIALYAANGASVIGNTLIGDGVNTQYGIISAWSLGLAGTIHIKGNVIRSVTSMGIYVTAEKAGGATVRLRGNAVQSAANGIRVAGPFASAVVADNVVKHGSEGQAITVNGTVKAHQTHGNKTLKQGP